MARSAKAREFAWVARHPTRDIRSAERAYLDSPEKAAIPRRPGELFESSEVRVMTPVAGVMP